MHRASFSSSIASALLFAILLLQLPASLAAPDGQPRPAKGKLLFSDSFDRADLGKWKVIIPGFRVEAGELIGTQDKPDHGSVGRLYLPMKDLVMSFRFKLAGSPRFNVVFDDKNYKGSHAGHIARVAFAQRQIRLGDDKEGIMRNDIFEMRRNPKTRERADQLIEGRGLALKADLKQNRWYTAEIEILGDRMRVWLDGQYLGQLNSPGLAHPTKESVHFTVSGKAVHFDDLRIWQAVR